MTTPAHPTGSLIGYARVSSIDQNLDLQRDALTAAGCDQVFEDTVSGAAVVRPGLEQAMAYLRPGDTFVVWRLDRLGRNLTHLISTVEALAQRNVGFKSLTEAIDTTTSGGRLVFQIFGALAEFERSLIRERTQAGLAAARARGKHGGRRPKLNAEKREILLQLYDAREQSVEVICANMGVSRSALYGYLRARRVAIERSSAT